jgi:4-oxalocrotonate tautomerase
MPLTTSNARELVFDRGNQSARYNDFDVQGVFMPFIQVHLAAGRSEEQKRALLLAISAAVQSSIGAPAESVRVWIKRVSAGGVRRRRADRKRRSAGTEGRRLIAQFATVGDISGRSGA